MDLRNKVAIVTGADSGIGRAIAVAFAGAGADVAITFHTDEVGAEETARQVAASGRRAAVSRLDVRSSAEVDAVFGRFSEELGVAEVLVNNAGKAMGGKAEVSEIEDEQLDTIIRTNLYGPLFCARAFLRLRGDSEGGRIINISSVAQHLPTAESAPYGMSKAGLGSFTRSLSVELAPRRINVVGIAPGLIATPMTAERMNDPQKREESFEEIPLHRAGEPEEIARVALFLAGPGGDYVTGQTWTIDGGLTMNWGGA